MNIKIGQYIAGDSILHKLDPRIKIMSMILLIIAIFLVPINIELKNIISMGLLFVFSLSIVYLSGIPLGKVLQGLKAIVFLMTFTFIIQLFTIQPTDEPTLMDAPMTLGLISMIALVLLTIFYHYMKTKIKWRITWFFIYVVLIFVVQWLIRMYVPMYDFGFSLDYNFKIFPSGLIRGGFIFLRIIAVMVIASLLTYTTSTIELNDGLESLMKPLRIIKIPTYIFSMMISLTLRSIPTLLVETDKIMKAQTSRGADFNESTLRQKIGQIIALLIPVFVISFDRADDLSNAMEARGYIIGEPRTKLDVYKINYKDIIILSVVILIIAGLLVTRFAI